jgi:hypothetical protein
MGPTGCPETLVINYANSHRNNPEERSSHINTLCGQNRSLFSLKQAIYTAEL